MLFSKTNNNSTSRAKRVPPARLWLTLAVFITSKFPIFPINTNDSEMIVKHLGSKNSDNWKLLTEVSNFPKVKTVEVSSKIITLNEEIQDSVLFNVVNLDLSKNLLLRLMNNELVELCNALQSCYNLEKLDLSNNGLFMFGENRWSKLANSFKKTPHLKIVNLDENGLIPADCRFWFSIAEALEKNKPRILLDNKELGITEENLPIFYRRNNNLQFDWKETLREE
jgi:hypothetical protein